MPLHSLDSLHLITPAAWDALLPEPHPFLRHAFLSALEDSGSLAADSGWRPAHRVLYDAHGQALAAMITAWVFGREFSDHTVKELLALPTPREVIVGAKFLLLILWILLLTLWIVGLELVIGWLVEIPGWSVALAQNTFSALLVIALLNFMLMPFVALIASLASPFLGRKASQVVVVNFAPRIGFSLYSLVERVGLLWLRLATSLGLLVKL